MDLIIVLWNTAYHDMNWFFHIEGFSLHQTCNNKRMSPLNSIDQIFPLSPNLHTCNIPKGGRSSLYTSPGMDDSIISLDVTKPLFPDYRSFHRMIIVLIKSLGIRVRTNGLWKDGRNVSECRCANVVDFFDSRRDDWWKASAEASFSGWRRAGRFPPRCCQVWSWWPQ